MADVPIVLTMQSFFSSKYSIIHRFCHEDLTRRYGKHGNSPTIQNSLHFVTRISRRRVDPSLLQFIIQSYDCRYQRPEIKEKDLKLK